MSFFARQFTSRQALEGSLDVSTCLTMHACSSSRSIHSAEGAIAVRVGLGLRMEQQDGMGLGGMGGRVGRELEDICEFVIDVGWSVVLQAVNDHLPKRCVFSSQPKVSSHDCQAAALTLIGAWHFGTQARIQIPRATIFGSGGVGVPTIPKKVATNAHRVQHWKLHLAII